MSPYAAKDALKSCVFRQRFRLKRPLGHLIAATFLAALIQVLNPAAGEAAPLDQLHGEPADAAASAATDPGASGPVRVDLATVGSHRLSIPRGKAAIVDLPVDARDVMIGNPSVAEAVMRTSRRISILGVAPGQTDVIFSDAGGRRILSLNVRVDQDFTAVADTISRVLPGSRVIVEGVNNSVILSGQVANLADANKAVQIAQQFTSKPEQVLNMLSIAGKDQVMVKVRIVEVQRSVIKQLGVNLGLSINQGGQTVFSFNNSASFAINSGLLGGASGAGYSLSKSVTNGISKATATVDAFERVGLVRTLAEPNLTAVSGESAKFLAGGEFPVPTGEDTTGKVTLEFKTYGVGLGFTPVVLSGGRISMKISTEVSELSNQGSYSLTTGVNTTITIPGIKVRRAETTVEMPSGGSMMIAGLLEEETKQNIDSIPGLNSLPVLGALFRSRDYLEGETELMVIITPYIVNSTAAGNLQTPADGLQIASDAETDLMGRLNKAYKTPAAAVAGRTYQGPLGYVIE